MSQPRIVDNRTPLAGDSLTMLEQNASPIAAQLSPRRRARQRLTDDSKQNWVDQGRLQASYRESPCPSRSGEPVRAAGVRNLGVRHNRRFEDRLVALLGHELRAPVSALQNYSELLVDYLDGDLTSSQAQVAVRRIHSLSIELGQMIQDIFEMARISNGRLDVARDSIELLAVVESAVATARTLPMMPPISVEMQCEDSVIRGDARRLSSVVLNLLTNAARHATRTNRIDVRITKDDTCALIEVEDYGQGIPSSDLPLIFTRHYQVHRPGVAASRHSDGLGLGLYVAQQIVNAHGGHIDVKSMLGMGTRFTISLPR